MTTEQAGCLIFDGYKLIKESLDCVPVNDKKVILTISPNSYGLSLHDERMNKALKCADYLQLDGVYFGWLPWFRDGKRAKRITGWDSFMYYAHHLESSKGKMFSWDQQKNTGTDQGEYEKGFPPREGGNVFTTL